MTTNMYPMIITGFSLCSEEDAWDDFDRHLQNAIEWVRGHKYWRATPFLSTNSDFDKFAKEWNVRARIICSKEKLELTEVKLGRPYPAMDTSRYDETIGYKLDPGSTSWGSDGL